MDVTVSAEPTPSSITLSPSNKTNKNLSTNSMLAQFYSTYFRSQPFSLPDTLIYYITKNPSTSKCYQKLAQSCKHFFIKNPILVFRRLNFWQEGKGKCTYLYPKDIDLSDVCSKIWVTDELSIKYNYQIDKTAPFRIFPNIYKCDVKELTFVNQNISFNDLKFFASKCETIWFDNKVSVTNEDGTTVALEKVVETFTKVKRLTLYLDNRGLNVTSKTVEELLKIPHFTQLDYFRLTKIPEDFDMDTFYDYIKKNTKTKFNFNFSTENSEQYKNRLQIILNEIVATKNHNYKPPYLCFLGHNLLTSYMLWDLYIKS